MLLNFFVRSANCKRRLVARAKESFEKIRAQIGQYEALCDAMKAEPGDVALAWLLQQPDVTAPIIGPRTLVQLEAALRAVELQLSAEVLAKLDLIFPGYNPSPEDYAW